LREKDISRDMEKGPVRGYLHRSPVEEPGRYSLVGTS
jgi:hypothetical protein